MPLWGSVDNAANSAIYTPAQVNLPISAENRDKLYNNTTANAFVQNATVGVFGVDSSEQQVLVAGGEAKGAHAGWNLRKVGTGGRAGRVHYETLVAMGSMSGDGSDDAILADAGIQILVQPQNVSGPTNSPVQFSVEAVTIPPGGSISYQWRRNGANITNGGVYSNATTPTLSIANNATLSGNVFSVALNTAGAAQLISDNASITIV